MIQQERLVEKRYGRWNLLAKPNYVSFIFLLPVASQFGQHVYQGAPVFLSQPASVVIQYTFLAFAIGAWIAYRPGDQWSTVTKLFFLALIVTWLGASISAQWHQTLLNPTFVLVPTCLVMLLTKRPKLQEIWVASTVFACAIVAIAGAAQLLDWSGIRPLHYEGWNRTWIQIWDTFPILFNLIDYGSRWEGPFGNVNYAGPIGAFLVVFGLVRQRAVGTALVLVGTLFLFVADSRSAWIAATVSGLTFFGVTQLQRPGRAVSGSVSIAVAVGVLGVFFGALVRDLSLTGRRSFWAAYLGQSDSFSMFGVGDRGIASLIEDDRLPAMATHGHSLLIDSVLRHGIAVSLLIVLCLVLAVVIAVRAEVSVRPASLSLVVLFVVWGVSEGLVNWSYLNMYFVPLIMAAMIGDRCNVRKLPEHSVTSKA